MEINNFEIRSNIKFLVKLEWKGTNIMEALQKVYGINAPKKTAVYKWIQRFREGREDMEDDPRNGRPTTSKTDDKIDGVRNLIEEDRRITVNQVAESLDISYGSANSILHEDLGLSKLSARWVPKALRPDQLVLRSDLSMAILTKIEANEELFMKKIITGDETWIYQYDPEYHIIFYFNYTVDTRFSGLSGTNTSPENRKFRLIENFSNPRVNSSLTRYSDITSLFDPIKVTHSFRRT